MLGKCFYIGKINLSQEGDLPLTPGGSKEKSCWNHRKHFTAGRTLQWRVPLARAFGPSHLHSLAFTSHQGLTPSLLIALVRLAGLQLSHELSGAVLWLRGGTLAWHL